MSKSPDLSRVILATIASACASGALAANQRAGISTCPYPRGTEEWHAWREAYSSTYLSTLAAAMPNCVTGKGAFG